MNCAPSLPLCAQHFAAKSFPTLGKAPAPFAMPRGCKADSDDGNPTVAAARFFDGRRGGGGDGGTPGKLGPSSFFCSRERRRERLVVSCCWDPPPVGPSFNPSSIAIGEEEDSGRGAAVAPPESFPEEG